MHIYFNSDCITVQIFSAFVTKHDTIKQKKTTFKIYNVIPCCDDIKSCTDGSRITVLDFKIQRVLSKWSLFVPSFFFLSFSSISFTVRLSCPFAQRKHTSEMWRKNDQQRKKKNAPRQGMGLKYFEALGGRCDRYDFQFLVLQKYYDGNIWSQYV